ncbi:hypothetical protein T11_11759 [Trichinella zimbabwensis]|uniref:Uncharacterized protein n=1 Tax=Trichinella zimbabwensis TaxID=268475 RepID=A0A0V1I3A7_9BILA|nr:hypothetical protein T11_16522 [Trichinella zimbabwensis]KRZ17263.1 hypothetical protein T11_11759 [Trichinella zimbabwensis]
MSRVMAISSGMLSLVDTRWSIVDQFLYLSDDVVEFVRILDRTDESFPVTAAPRGSGCDEFPPDPFLIELALQFFPVIVSEQTLDECICQFERPEIIGLYHSGSASAGDKSPKTL